MVSVQKEGKYVYLNPTALKVLGASKPEELVGKSILDIVHPDYWDAARDRHRLIEQGKPVPLIQEKIVRLDQKVIDVELRQIEVLDRDDHTVMVVGQDITEQKKAVREKELLQEQLQQAQKMEAIGTLAGGIAHDFNNILAAILGYAELASLDIPKDSKAQENLQNSIKSAHRAKNLVQQILAFSRQKKQERRPMDIRPIMKEGVKFLRASLPSTIEIRQEMEENLGTIEADPTQIHQVLINLCMNASQAMDGQGGVLGVFLNKIDLDEGRSLPGLGLEPGPYLRLRVSDTGQGIPPEILPRIFDPYFTTKEVGKGTGLGLAVVHGILKSYGGGISVSSEVGKGSSFDVYFPRIEAPGSTLEAVKVEPLPRGRKERVLFVDDEQAIVEIGQKFLEYLGYEVVVRTSSLEALELFRAKADQFDLVITDMTMPNLTGEGLARGILGIRPGMPIILCTGFSEHMSGEKAKALGIREFVLKPLVVMDLAKAIRRSLDSGEEKKG
jgi:PAS domain S-box-containing protein